MAAAAAQPGSAPYAGARTPEEVAAGRVLGVAPNAECLDRRKPDSGPFSSPPGAVQTATPGTAEQFKAEQRASATATAPPPAPREHFVAIGDRDEGWDACWAGLPEDPMQQQQW